jgi:hypothetical protein
MTQKKNKILNNSNENMNHNKIKDQSKDLLKNSTPNLNPSHNYEPFDFTVNQEFIQENKKINLNLVRPRHKFAPFTRAQRRKRRMEVYRLHFENGMPVLKIAEFMKVDRNTINNDLKILYNKALQDYNPDMSLDDILQKQLVRLEAQRDRLGLYLCDAKDLNSKITIERLIADIDFRLIGVIERVNQNVVRYWDDVIKHVNKIAESEKLKTRYTNPFEINKISRDSRQRLDKLKEEIFKDKGW